MAIVEGKEIVRITLNANEQTIIRYADQQQLADIITLDAGDVFVSWRGTASDTASCLKLTEGLGYELRPRSPWRELSLLSANTVEVQVVVR